ncbi:DUF5979 domain-containing protein [Corynebacterium freiburgense]|uniref:DUF5979 domain-containing protein n=1 Tax=Corynebacterium freiburgense TaxID=556548 RepID=UPI000479082A|nr:DUF5979 domain-containing protein [Corynebacterium freiburgense]WJZ01442.1 T surface-antigen of pili [Corynebacterium freiburgense]
MSFVSKEGRGESVILIKGKQVATIVAAFFAVIALILSMLVMAPAAHAVTDEDLDATSQESPEGTAGDGDGASRSVATAPDQEKQPPLGDEPKSHNQTRAFRSPGSPKNWANEYIESVDVYKSGSATPLTSPPAKEADLVAGTGIVLQINWSALGKEQAAPDDVIHVELPQWLTLSNNINQSMGNVGACKGVSGQRQITCTFVQPPDGYRIEKGYLKFTATAVKTETAQAFKFGNVDVDAYYYHTGRKSGPVKGVVYNPEAVGDEVKKSGQYSFEYDVNGQKYSQIVWHIVIPSKKVNEIVDAGGAIEITDTLQPLTVVDPDTGKNVELPHYIAPMARGPYSVLRRTGDSLNKGTWANISDDGKCAPGKEYEQAGIKCAEKIYGNVRDTWQNFPGNQGENVEFTGVTPEGSWGKGKTFTARVENLVRDSAYRLSFFSVVPADLLKLRSEESPKVQNTAQVNGVNVETKDGVAVYVKGEVGASIYPNATNFVIKKEVLPDFQDSDVKEFKLRYTVGDKTEECKVAPGSDCRIEKVSPTTPVTIEELAVEGSKLKWQPGVFTHVNQGANKTQVEINGNRATIAQPAPGERVVLLLSNTYSDKTGSLQIKKSVQGLDNPDLVGENVQVDYTCVPAGEPEDSEPSIRVTVPTNGEIKEIPNIPVGYECYVQENVNSGEIEGHRIAVKYEPESRKVTIKEGQGENGSNLVTINNTYTLETAALSIKKVIAGERPQGLNDDTEFTVKYQCNADSKDGKVKANQLAELKINAKGDVTEGPEFPHHTRCSVKEEKTDAPKFEDYGFTADLGKEVVIGRDADANTITVTNTFKKDEAKFRVTKAISGDAQDIAAAKTYEFEYTCGQETGRLQVTGAGTVESDKAFPVGTECAVQELGTEPNGAAQIENHILNVEPNGEQRFVVGKGENPTFTNNYTVKKAKFAVVKTAEGENGKARELTYQFDYVCGGVNGTVNAKADGVPVESDNEFPVGTRCDITERHQPGIIDGYEDVTEPSARMKQVEIGVDQVVRAEFKNSYAREMGKFRVTKKVVKDAELAIPGEFTVDYRCTKDGEEAKEGTLVVPADGSVDSEELPTGYACVITGEKDDQGQAQAPGATLVTEIGSGVKIAKGNVPEIQVTNTYSKDFGQFTITKSVVDPDGIAEGKVFEFNYVCTPPEHRKDETPVEGTLKVKAGESATSPKIPAEFSCTITEVGAEITDSNLVTTGLDSKLVIEKDGGPKVDVENTYSQWKGTLEVSKEISGSEAVKKAVGDHQFDVSYICMKNGKETNKGTLKVKAGETVTVPGVVANSECTVTENPDSAAVGELRFEPGASTTKVVASKIVADGGVGAAKLINAYVELGKFAVAKRVEGVHGGADDKEFKFNYTCGADSGMLTVRGNGTPVGSDKVFPVGTECTITEDADSATIADHADVTPGAERVKKVTIGAGAPTIVGFTNTYSRDMGKFQVAKKVVTNAADLKIPGEFKVDYRCTKDGEEAKEGTLTVPNNGSVESEEMPTGYSCVVTREHDAQAPGATLVTEISSGVKIAKGSVPAVQVTNTYSKNFGEFTITKSVVDPDRIADGKVFEFNYVCTPPEHRKDETPVEGTLKVKAGESATSPKIPAEFSCTITEVGAEITDSNLVTTGLDSKLVIETDKNGKVEVENKYSQWKGTLKISKVIIGTPAVEKLVGDREFDISLKCVKNGRTTNEDRVKVKVGETVTVNGIVANSVCTVEENTDAVDVQGLRFLKDSSITRIDAPKITADGGVTEAQIQNAYAELGHLSVVKEVTGLTGNVGRIDREFEIVATWTDNGETVEKEFTVRDGEEFKDFPPLPVGTKVTLKEKHPGNNIVQQWRTPGFTSDRVGAVVDNRDGTAVVTIVGDTPADKPLQVKLKNTSNPPWWWLLAPFAILGLGNNGNQNGGPNDGGGNQNGGTNQNGGAGDSSKSGTSAKSNGATLARTGASVLGVLALAGLVTAAGIFMVRRSRKQN